MARQFAGNVARGETAVNRQMVYVCGCEGNGQKINALGAWTACPQRAEQFKSVLCLNKPVLVSERFLNAPLLSSFSLLLDF